jgi:hypothetical protein
MIYPKGTLRVVSPVTVDGNRPKIVNGMQVYKETYLPKTARRALENQNKRLPDHLKKKIEPLEEDYVDPAQGVQPVEAPAEKPKGKPGPKPKVHAETN